MTSWGVWSCPECGKKWEGSIGYSMNTRWDLEEAEKELNEVLKSICGCTHEEVKEGLVKIRGSK